MSDVRWCDRHNGPFPVPSDGWVHSVGTRTSRVDGRTVTQNVEIDVCGKCEEDTEPRYELPAPKATTSTGKHSGQDSWPGLVGNSD